MSCSSTVWTSTPGGSSGINDGKVRDEMNWKKGAQIAFLAVGALTVLEFLFVRGLFTWLVMVLAVVALGAVNIVLSARDRRWQEGLHYLLTTVALCMGYLVLA